MQLRSLHSFRKLTLAYKTNRRSSTKQTQQQTATAVSATEISAFRKIGIKKSGIRDKNIFEIFFTDEITRL